MANRSQSAVLGVVGINSLDAPCHLEFDEYVPLQWRTSEEPLGGGGIRLGNADTTILEIAVQQFSRMVRGATLTAIGSLSPWPQFSLVTWAEGLPILSTAIDTGHVVDCRQDFRIGVRQHEIVVYGDELGPCDGSVFKRANCLVRNGRLVGIWFNRLTDKEIDRFLIHAH